MKKHLDEEIIDRVEEIQTEWQDYCTQIATHAALTGRTVSYESIQFGWLMKKIVELQIEIETLKLNKEIGL